MGSKALANQNVAERRGGITLLAIVPVAIILNAQGKWQAANKKEIEAGLSTPFPRGTFTLDGEPVCLSDFIDTNELGAEQVAAIAQLQPGETMNFGGGASATFVLRREGGGA